MFTHKDLKMPSDDLIGRRVIVDGYYTRSHGEKGTVTEFSKNGNGRQEYVCSSTYVVELDNGRVLKGIGGERLKDDSKLSAEDIRRFDRITEYAEAYAILGEYGDQVIEKLREAMSKDDKYRDKLKKLKELRDPEGIEKALWLEKYAISF